MFRTVLTVILTKMVSIGNMLVAYQTRNKHTIFNVHGRSSTELVFNSTNWFNSYKSISVYEYNNNMNKYCIRFNNNCTVYTRSSPHYFISIISLIFLLICGELLDLLPSLKKWKVHFIQLSEYGQMSPSSCRLNVFELPLTGICSRKASSFEFVLPV